MISGSYHFKIGKFDCTALSDGTFNYPLEAFFANAPQEKVKEDLFGQEPAKNYVNSRYNLFLVDTGEHRVMIDTGAGNLATMASRMFPSVPPSTDGTGTLLTNLKSSHLQPEDIDIVIITHAHPDHINGTLDEGGILTFPRARYFIDKRELEFWTTAQSEGRASLPMIQIARRNLEPLQIRLETVEGGTEIVPGVTVLDAAGHTPGHLCVAIRSEGDSLLHIADTALHPLHLMHPDWFPSFDVNPESAVSMKRKIFETASEEKTILFGHHFAPFPGLGVVMQEGEGWRWQPLSR